MNSPALLHGLADRLQISRLQPDAGDGHDNAVLHRQMTMLACGIGLHHLASRTCELDRFGASCRGQRSDNDADHAIGEPVVLDNRASTAPRSSSGKARRRTAGNRS